MAKKTMRDRVYLAAVTGLAMAWDGEPVTPADADKVVEGALAMADAHDRADDAAKLAQAEADKLAREALARRIESVRFWTWTDNMVVNMSDAPAIVVGEVVAVRMTYRDARLDTGHMSGKPTSVEFGSFDGGDGDVQPATRAATCATVRAAAMAGEATWTPAMRALVVGALAGEGGDDAAELPDGVARLARIYRELVVRESAVYPDAAAFLAAFTHRGAVGFDARLRIGTTTTCAVDGNGRVLLAATPTRHLLDLALDDLTGDVRHLRTALRTLVQSSTNDEAIRTAMFAVATALRLDAEVV